MGGNDTITGNNNTRMVFTNATAGVTVASTGQFAGTVDGDGSVGHDTYTGVNSITGSAFGDTITTGTGSDTIIGGGGNDTINGGASTDMAVFTGLRSDYTINFSTPAVGQTQVIDNVAGRDGTDALTSIEVLQFSNAYVMAMAGSSASPITVTGLAFSGNTNTFFGTNNVAGDFLAIGPGLSGHTIDMQGGTDTVILATAGNYSIGLLNTEFLTGSTGNDTVNLSTTISGMSVDLGTGTDVLSLASGTNSLTVNNVETITTADFSGAASNDTLTLLNNVTGGMTVNLQQGNNTLNLAAGSNNFVDIYNVQHVKGTASDDTLTLSDQVYEPGGNPIVDLGAGNDTLNFGSQYEVLSAISIEQINGNALDNGLTLNNNVNGTAIDLGAGNDSVGLAVGANSISVTNVEIITSTDFTGTASNDTLTLLNDINGVSINLAQGDNTLNLAAGVNSVTNLYNIGHLNGTASDDTLTVTQTASNTIFDMGAGNDTINFTGSASNVTVINAETVISGAGNDFITVGNTTGTTVLTGGGGADTITASAGHDVLRFTATSDSSAGAGRDTVNNFDAANDSFVFDHVGGLSVPVHFVASGVLDGSVSTPHPEAVLTNVGGVNVLQIDVNGDGQIGAGDMEVALNGLSGTLTDINFTTLAVNSTPTNILLSNASVAENSAPGTVVGTLSDADADIGDSASYVLTDNAGGLFAISGGNLVVAGALDYEAAASRQVTVQVTDSANNIFSKTIQIGITNVNEAPTNVTLSNASVAVSSAVNTVVGALTAVDPDAGDSATFTLTNNDGGLFAISGNNIVVASSLSGVTSAAQQVTVHATDAGSLSVDKVLTLNVTGIASTTFAGDAGDNTLTGTAANERFQGFGGNDTINGGDGFDRAIYSDASGGIAFNLASGTVTGPGVGTDTLTNIEGIVGTNSADTYDATGFTGSTNVPGTPVGFNEFEGMGGDDVITSSTNSQGAPLTRVSYLSATAAVTVDLQAKTADGNASVGHDTFIGSGVANVLGSAFNDILSGSNNPNGTVEVFEGRAGNDTINGRGGFDRADYINDPATTSGITVNLAAGTVTGDATVGTDTLISVEGVRGTAFADTYNAGGFSGTSVNAGSLGTFNEFTGGAGNDLITGNGATRLSYNNATAGITFDIAAGTATGDASVGTDTFTGVNAVQATMYNDFLYGGATNDVFTGLAGNDTIDGRGGFDTATYFNTYFVTGGISINMTTGVVTGDASTGTDTLRSIEAIQGTTFADTYTAANFGAAGFLDTSVNNVGNNGTFNQFEGMGGNDTITGNNNTRMVFTNATAGVTVTSTGQFAGTVDGDGSVGHDTYTGVNSITGSAFGDTITTGTGSDTIIGGSGDDTINGGASTDMAVFTGLRSDYTINFSTPAVGQTQVIDTVANRDGTDALTSIEILQFSNQYVMAATGTSASPITVTGLGFTGNTNTFFGTNNAAGDFLAIGTGLSGHTIDMQTGTDTVILATAGNYSIGLLNDEFLTGSAGNDFLTLTTNVTGLSVDMAAGTDTLNLAGGVNSLSAANIENIGSSDFSGAASNDTLTLLNDVSGLTVNLQQGNNTLNLAAGTNSFVDIYSVQHVNGTSSDDTLTLTDQVYETGGNPIVDLGAGHDVLSFGSQYETLTAVNIEQINGNALDNGLTLKATVTGLAIDLGAGADILNLANGANSISVTNVENIFGTDFTGTASDDTLTLTNNVSGVSVNLAQGDNTLNLAAGTNSVDNLFGIGHLNGSATDDTLTVTQSTFSTIFDMGAGNDTINFNAAANNVTVVNAETVNGSAANDTITIANTTGTTTVTGGLGTDTITASASADNFHFAGAAESAVGAGDQIVNFNANTDNFTFSTTMGFAGPVHFMDTASFDGTAGAPHSEARVDTTGGNATLQIDVNGDGQMGANDIEIHLTNYTGTLQDHNFIIA
jgi:hypothetical protein